MIHLFKLFKLYISSFLKKSISLWFNFGGCLFSVNIQVSRTRNLPISFWLSNLFSYDYSLMVSYQLCLFFSFLILFISVLSSSWWAWPEVCQSCLSIQRTRFCFVFFYFFYFFLISILFPFWCLLLSSFCWLQVLFVFLFLILLSVRLGYLFEILLVLWGRSYCFLHMNFPLITVFF